MARDSKPDNSPKEEDRLNLEDFFNRLMQHFFPLWYCCQSAKELEMEDLGNLNPASYQAARWMDLRVIAQHIGQSAQAQGPQWSGLAEHSSQLVKSKTLKRIISILDIKGVEHSESKQDWPNLYEYAQGVCQDIDHETVEDFEANLIQVFGEADQRLAQVCYREWDGRMYWRNQSAQQNREPKVFGALIAQAIDKQRDANVRAEIRIDYVDQQLLTQIRQQYWLLLMRRPQAFYIQNLAERSRLPCIICEFDWRRSDLVILASKRNHRGAQRLVNALLKHHSPNQIMEFGRLLAANQHRFAQ